ncbi:MAG: DUF6279 family lipoprotein [Gammaproteobacteria bacterium]
MTGASARIAWPDMIELFAMASDEQVEDLFSKFAEDDARYRKEYLEQSLDEQRRQRAKEVRHYVERWTGTLDDKQRKLIKRWSESFDPMGDDFCGGRCGRRNSTAFCRYAP